eukprot:CCRYP_016691-RH/>CCRYP_016691-RH protein AED:0.48 eAED:0.46 QI:0/-1/0/1/-1/1/1/0/120
MAREAVFIRIILEELGHTQPATPLQTDNSTAEGVVNGKIQPKRTKAMDMRFHWLEIVNAKNSSASTGAQENSITRTIGLNITLSPITNTYGRSLSHHNSSWQCYDLANAPNQLHQLPSST